MKHIRILFLAVLAMPCMIGCTPGTSPSKANKDGATVNDKDSLSFSKEEFLSTYDVFFAPCNVRPSGRVRFARLFNRKKADAELIVSMTGINCCKMDFLFGGLPHDSVYDMQNWEIDYEQLIQLKEDKRACPMVVTDWDKNSSDFEVMSCEGKTQLSTLSIEALRFLNAKVLDYYPCPIAYTYEEIDSIHALHPENWGVRKR